MLFILSGCCAWFEEPRSTHVEAIQGIEEYPYAYKLKVKGSRCWGTHMFGTGCFPVPLVTPTSYSDEMVIYLKTNQGKVDANDIKYDGDLGLIENNYQVRLGRLKGHVEFSEGEIIFNLRRDSEVLMVLDIEGRGATDEVERIVSNRNDFLPTDKITIYSDEARERVVFQGNISSILQKTKIRNLYLEKNVFGKYMIGFIQSSKLGKSFRIEFWSEPTIFNGVYSLEELKP